FAAATIGADIDSMFSQTNRSEAQREAMKEENLEEEALSDATHKLETGVDGIKYLIGRAWILKVNKLRNIVMDEAHISRYSIHMAADTMYMVVKEYYWWLGMKKDIPFDDIK
ncbi:putative reverse transcriptase domain-containing protein, partial [Tanacetum coccineum]